MSTHIDLLPTKKTEDSFKIFFKKTFGEDVIFMAWRFNILDGHIRWFKTWLKPMIFECIVFGSWNNPPIFHVFYIQRSRVIFPDGSSEGSDSLIESDALGNCLNKTLKWKNFLQTLHKGVILALHSGKGYSHLDFSCPNERTVWN